MTVSDDGRQTPTGLPATHDSGRLAAESASGSRSILLRGVIETFIQ